MGLTILALGAGLGDVIPSESGGEDTTEAQDDL